MTQKHVYMVPLYVSNNKEDAIKVARYHDGSLLMVVHLVIEEGEENGTFEVVDIINHTKIS